MTATVMSACSVCEAPTPDSCALCLQPACAQHLEETGLCVTCSRGRRAD